MATGTGVPIPGAQAALTVDATAGGIALTVPTTTPKATWARITVETAPIRFFCDGTAPTSANGHLVGDGGQILLQSVDEIRKFRAIRSTGVSGVLQVTYGSD